MMSRSTSGRSGHRAYFDSWDTKRRATSCAAADRAAAAVSGCGDEGRKLVCVAMASSMSSVLSSGLAWRDEARVAASFTKGAGELVGGAL